MSTYTTSHLDDNKMFLVSEKKIDTRYMSSDWCIWDTQELRLVDGSNGEQIYQYIIPKRTNP